MKALQRKTKQAFEAHWFAFLNVMAPKQINEIISESLCWLVATCLFNFQEGSSNEDHGLQSPNLVLFIKETM